MVHTHYRLFINLVWYGLFTGFYRLCNKKENITVFTIWWRSAITAASYGMWKWGYSLPVLSEQELKAPSYKIYHLYGCICIVRVLQYQICMTVEKITSKILLQSTDADVNPLLVWMQSYADLFLSLFSICVFSHLTNWTKDSATQLLSSKSLFVCSFQYLKGHCIT